LKKADKIAQMSPNVRFLTELLSFLRIIKDKPERNRTLGDICAQNHEILLKLMFFINQVGIGGALSEGDKKDVNMDFRCIKNCCA